MVARSQLGCRVNIPCLFFTAYGYEKHFGAKPSKAATQHTMMCMKADGSCMEKLWVFEYKAGAKASKYARQGAVWADTIFEQNFFHMSQNASCYEEQGMHALRAALATDQGNARGKKLRTIEMEAEFLAGKDGVGQRIGVNGEGDEASVDSDDLRFPDGDTQPVDGQVDSDPEGPARSELAASPASKRPAPSQIGRYLRASVPRSLPAAEEDDDTVVPEGTVLGSDDEEVEEVDEGDISSKVRLRIKKLDLTQVMLGKKFGNQKRRLIELEEKLAPDEHEALIAQLNKHKKLVQLAEELTPARIYLPKDVEMQAIVHELQQSGV